MSGKVHSVIGISTTIALLLVFIFIFKSDFSLINSLLMIILKKLKLSSFS